MSDWDKDNPGFDMFKHLHDISRNNLTYLSGVFPPLASSLAEWNLEMLRFSTRRAMEYRELSDRLSRCRTPNEMWAEQLRFFEQLQSEYSTEMGRLLALLNGVAQNAATGPAQGAADPVGEAARAAQAAVDTMAGQARETMAAAADMAAKSMAAMGAAQAATHAHAAAEQGHEAPPEPHAADTPPAGPEEKPAFSPASTSDADDGDMPDDGGDPDASMVSEPSPADDEEDGDAISDETHVAVGAIVSEDVTYDSEDDGADNNDSEDDQDEDSSVSGKADDPHTDRN